jgi:hypothetical protein
MGVDCDVVAGWGVSMGTNGLARVLNVRQSDDIVGIVDDLSTTCYEVYGSYYSGDQLWIAWLDPDPSIIHERLNTINEEVGTSFTSKDIRWHKETLLS